MPLFVIALIACALLVAVIGAPYWRKYQRDRIRTQVFPESWRMILRHRVPYVRLLPADLQLQLKKLIQIFIAEKAFIGCAGQVITDEIRVTVAAQACLLLLNRKTDMYPKLRQILVYPSAFYVPHNAPNELGLVTEGGRVLSGESWEQGNVVLSWHDTLEGARVTNDGSNVVIHEFAHQLDQEKGRATGAPILARSSHYQDWSATLSAAFEELRRQAAIGQEGLFSHYGATNPAEFFAVISEVFFEKPQEMSMQYPEVYRQLKQFYRLDPLSWS